MPFHPKPDVDTAYYSVPFSRKFPEFEDIGPISEIPEESVNEEAADATIWPRDAKNLGEVPALLKEYEGRYRVIRDDLTGEVSYFHVEKLDPETMYTLQISVRLLLLLFISLLPCSY